MGNSEMNEGGITQSGETLCMKEVHGNHTVRGIILAGLCGLFWQRVLAVYNVIQAAYGDYCTIFPSEIWRFYYTK